MYYVKCSFSHVFPMTQNIKNGLMVMIVSLTNKTFPLPQVFLFLKSAKVITLCNQGIALISLMTLVS